MSHALSRASRRDTDFPSLQGLTITETLESCHAATRWKARDAHGQPFTAYRLRASRGRASELRSQLEPLLDVRHPHLLPIDRFITDADDRLWLIAPFTGNHDGLVHLANLLPMKEAGQMSPDEAERAVLHTLEALAALHDAGFNHGPPSMDALLVDRHGSVMLELPAVHRVVSGLAPRGDSEMTRDEIHAVGGIAYELITGMVPGDPRIPAARLVRRLSRTWNDWLEHAMDETGGFDSIDEAIRALPSRGEDRVTLDREPGMQAQTRAGRLLRRLPGSSSLRRR